ncbi:hypothetical protein I553_0012 [Mycobacterium xenopi 4042]|uniref:Uncharacterized protein n=1 Tax=Mycobacterium xenopi 4042 TaxID=1299334 RepID=X8AGV9_MYCXE|nr:hypothetical protein I553_0012 [Mycobacterium xenopi 4042]
MANAFDPSIRAASLEGPKQATPASRSASATRAPAVSRADHHQIRPHPAGQRNNFFRRGDVDRVLLGDQRGPGVAGAMASASTSGSSRSASSRACSRAPEPITKTRTTRHPSGRPG